jgi:carbamate kinase
VLIALGGNAMTSADGSARPEDQKAAITLAMEAVADVVATGAQVVLTHGNGPQVGNLLVKNELAAHVVPPVPLDWCGAQTQATIGFLIMNALDAALERRGVAGQPRWCPGPWCGLTIRISASRPSRSAGTWAPRKPRR